MLKVERVLVCGGIRGTWYMIETTYPNGAKIGEGALSSPDAILNFWFGEAQQLDDINYIHHMMGLWFARASATFDAVQSNNKDLLPVIASASGDMWISPKGYLARIIVLDQFPRSIYRGTEQAFAYDALVSRLCCEVIEKEWISQYAIIQQFFIGVALQHSENLAHQELGVSIANGIISGSNTELAKYFSNLKGYPHEHFDVIEKFGRFPSRNEILVMRTA